MGFDTLCQHVLLNYMSAYKCYFAAVMCRVRTLMSKSYVMSKSLLNQRLFVRRFYGRSLDVTKQLFFVCLHGWRSGCDSGCSF